MRRQYRNDLYFIGESFLLSSDKMVRLLEAGFNDVYNSAFWYLAENQANFGWLVDQLNYPGLEHSIAIAANHDTERIYTFAHENPDKTRMILAYSFLISNGVSMTAGEEFSASRKSEVVRHNPSRFDCNGDFTTIIKSLVAFHNKFSPMTQTEMNRTGNLLTVIRSNSSGESYIFALNNSDSDTRIEIDGCTVKMSPYGFYAAPRRSGTVMPAPILINCTI